MNIGVYVTSNYTNYDKLSKMLTSYIKKYTTNPVILTASSPSTKPNHGNNLVRRYAEENRIRYKIYETEWNKWKKSAGSIASYHMNHNSERSLVFWDGLSKGCRNYLMMTKRLRRPCDLIRVNPNDGVEVKPKEPIIKEPLPTTDNRQSGVAPATPQGGSAATTPQQTTPNAAIAPQGVSPSNGNQQAAIPPQGQQQTGGDAVADVASAPGQSNVQQSQTNNQQSQTQQSTQPVQTEQPQQTTQTAPQQPSLPQGQNDIETEEKEVPESEQSIEQLTVTEPLDNRT